MNSCVQLSLNLLLKHVTKAKPPNAAVSPLSLNAAVAMLAAGCSGRSLDRVLTFARCKSLEELKSRFSKSMSIVGKCSGEGCPKISFVNGAWAAKRLPLKPSYQQCLMDTFKSEPKVYDFVNQADEAVRDINSWAKFQTNGLIESVIQREQIKPLTAMILGNALYFRGFWWDKFNPECTEHKDFYLLNGDKISDVPFMTSSNHYRYRSFEDFKVLEIPYRDTSSSVYSTSVSNFHTPLMDREVYDRIEVLDKRSHEPYEPENQFCMQIILPHKRDGLKNLLEKMNNNNADSSGLFNGHLKYTEIHDFWIPKFKFSHMLDDVNFPFMDGDEGFDLAEMFEKVEGDLPFVATNVVQKAFVEVNEEGTEAAAVTLFDIEESCPMFLREHKIKSFVADHPFLFVIKENISGLVLFVGAVLNPLQQD